MPAALTAFAEHNLGQLHEITDTSGPRENSHVWRVVAGRARTTWFVKEHPHVRHHGREVQAYAQWTPSLGADRAPLLRAADPALSAVILSALPGIAPVGPDLPQHEEREVHRQLGELLHRFHHSSPSRPPTFQHPARDKVQLHLDAAGPHLRHGDEALIRHLAGRLALLTPLPRVPTHGDVQLRNTLWNPDTGTLGLIDYERAEYQPACHDLIRLEYGPWEDRPDLKTAFFTGFGTPLAPLETDHIHAIAALDALSGIAYAASTGDEELLARGQHTLERLHSENG
jgi:Ser/Thr protein kinase RdoA (MazF antagonist)